MRGAVAFNNIFIKHIKSGWLYQKVVLSIVTERFIETEKKQRQEKKTVRGGSAGEEMGKKEE